MPVPPFVDISYTTCRLLPRSPHLSSRDERRKGRGRTSLRNRCDFLGKSTCSVRFDRIKIGDKIPKSGSRLGLLPTTLLPRSIDVSSIVSLPISRAVIRIHRRVNAMRNDTLATTTRTPLKTWRNPSYIFLYCTYTCTIYKSIDEQRNFSDRFSTDRRKRISVTVYQIHYL